MQYKYRVMEFGVQSYFRSDEVMAIAEAEKVIKRNGCGMIERYNGESWRVIYRFDGSNGLVAA